MANLENFESENRPLGEEVASPQQIDPAKMARLTAAHEAKILSDWEMTFETENLGKEEISDKQREHGCLFGWRWRQAGRQIWTVQAVFEFS